MSQLAVHALDALGVACALRDLGREERARIGEGRIEALEALAQRRADLLHRLDDVLPRGTTPSAEVNAVLDEVRREGAENLALLRSIQGEIATALQGEQRVGQAVKKYGSSSSI